MSRLRTVLAGAILQVATDDGAQLMFGDLAGSPLRSLSPPIYRPPIQRPCPRA